MHSLCPQNEQPNEPYHQRHRKNRQPRNNFLIF